MRQQHSDRRRWRRGEEDWALLLLLLEKLWRAGLEGGQAGRDTRSPDTHRASASHSSSMTDSEPIEITGIFVRGPTGTMFQPTWQTELEVNWKQANRRQLHLKILTGNFRELHSWHLSTICPLFQRRGRESEWMNRTKTQQHTREEQTVGWPGKSQHTLRRAHTLVSQRINISANTVDRATTTLSRLPRLGYSWWTSQPIHWIKRSNIDSLEHHSWSISKH